MRVTVMGSGGTGGYFGGLLARSGEEVTFIARGAHLAAIRARGLTGFSGSRAHSGGGLRCLETELWRLRLTFVGMRWYNDVG